MKPPPHPFAPSANATEQALQAAAFALQSNRPAEAERIAGEVLRRHRTDPRAAQLYGYALLTQGKAKDAIAPLERAFKQTRDPGVETQLAMALRQAGQTEQAVERFQHAVARKPAFPPAFLEFGVLLLSLGRRGEAIEVMRRGAAIAPEFGDLSVQLGNALIADGDRAGAREAFARALSLQPRNTDVMFALARIAGHDRDFAAAADYYGRILAIETDAAAQIGLGISLIEQGRREEGLDHLRVAARSDPKRYGEALAAIVSAGHGRFWLRPSAASRALRDGKS
jgi:tetratricopeptide (TPR) repeat protein